MSVILWRSAALTRRHFLSGIRQTSCREAPSGPTAFVGGIKRPGLTGCCACFDLPAESICVSAGRGASFERTVRRSVRSLDCHVDSNPDLRCAGNRGFHRYACCFSRRGKIFAESDVSPIAFLAVGYSDTIVFFKDPQLFRISESKRLLAAWTSECRYHLEPRALPNDRVSASWAVESEMCVI